MLVLAKKVGKGISNFFKRIGECHACHQRKLHLAREISTFPQHRLNDIGLPYHKIQQLLSEPCWKKQERDD